MDAIHVQLKAKIFQAGVTQEQVARLMGIEPATFSRILRGLRTMPEGFEKNLKHALDRLEAAGRAADEARARVLDDGMAER